MGKGMERKASAGKAFQGVSEARQEGRVEVRGSKRKGDNIRDSVGRSSQNSHRRKRENGWEDLRSLQGQSVHETLDYGCSP